MSQLAPVSINTAYYGGPLLVFDCTESELLAAGLLEPDEVPKPAPRYRREFRTDNDFLSCYRLADGRLRLTISAHLARSRDRAFVGFLAGLVVPLMAIEGGNV